MHAKVFSIQIFQYFRQIPPRVYTLVLFIIIVLLNELHCIIYAVDILKAAVEKLLLMLEVIESVIAMLSNLHVHCVQQGTSVVYVLLVTGSCMG